MDDDEEYMIATLVESGQQPDMAVPTVAPASIKMKLASFMPNKQLQVAIQKIVKDMNRVVAEAYCFGNFHITRLLNEGLPIPIINGTFYYTCMRCVTSSCKQTKMDAHFQASMQAFDALRPPGVAKVDVNGTISYNQVVASCRITMATMATNHLWMNIEGRLLRWLKWKHPHLKGTWSAIVKATLNPKQPVEQLISARGNDDSARAKSRVVAARQLAEELRSLVGRPTLGRFATRAHLLLPLYARILSDTTAAHQDQECLLKEGVISKRRMK